MIKLMQNYIHLQNWLFKKEPFAFLFDLHRHKAHFSILRALFGLHILLVSDQNAF